MIFLIYVIFYLKDPDASYDVNDRDPDPQPRYTQLNDNRYRFLSLSLLSFSLPFQSLHPQQGCQICQTATSMPYCRSFLVVNVLEVLSGNESQNLSCANMRTANSGCVWKLSVPPT